MAENTAPAIAGSIEVWNNVAWDPSWRADPKPTQQILYSQVSIWYQLVILGQDPTTLFPPGVMMRNYHAIARAIRMYMGQLTLAVMGIGGLIALIILLGSGTGGAIVNTLLAILAAAGFSAVGFSARRYTREKNIDLAAAVITKAPPPPRRGDLIRAISRRSLGYDGPVSMDEDGG
jgi:hypothetical protein